MVREVNVSLLDAFQLVSVIDAIPVVGCDSLNTCECTGTDPLSLLDQTQLLLNGKRILLHKAASIKTRLVRRISK